jgi:hypothetical protein
MTGPASRAFVDTELKFMKFEKGDLLDGRGLAKSPTKAHH